MTTDRIRTFAHGRAELMPNGFVRVDTKNDQVRVWERDTERICCRLRSGYPLRSNGGTPAIHVCELRAVSALLRCSDRWVQ
jgi:hypothetical protein